jgi:simple sugar transport system substrate-binding protein
MCVGGWGRLLASGPLGVAAAVAWRSHVAPVCHWHCQRGRPSSRDDRQEAANDGASQLTIPARSSLCPACWSGVAPACRPRRQPRSARRAAHRVQPASALGAEADRQRKRMSTAQAKRSTRLVQGHPFRRVALRFVPSIHVASPRLAACGTDPSALRPPEMAISHVKPSCGATIRPGLVILLALALVLCLLPLSAHGGGVPGAPTPATCACQPRATLSVWMFGHGDPANSAGWARLRAGFLESAKAMRVQTETFFLTTRELRAGGGDAAAGVANLITAQLLTPTEVQIVPNAILLSIPSAAAISAVLDLVRARFPGIRIATYGEGSALAASVGSLFHLGQDDEAAGTQAGVRLAQTGATSAVCVFDILGSLTQKTRCTAFATAFRANCVASSCSVNTTFLDSSDASFSAAFINGLKQGPGGKPHIGLLSVSPNLLPLLNSPIAALGLASPVASLASFDVTPLAQQMLSSNSTVALSFVVDQQEYAQGSLALTLTTYYLTTGQKVANAFIQTGPKLVFTVSEFVPPVLAHLHLDAIVHGLNSDAFWSVFHEGVEMAARDLGLQFTDCTDPASTCDFKTTRSLSKPSVYYNAPANSFDLVTMSHQIDVAVAAKPNGIAVSWREII